MGTGPGRQSPAVPTLLGVQVSARARCASSPDGTGGDFWVGLLPSDFVRLGLVRPKAANVREAAAGRRAGTREPRPCFWGCHRASTGDLSLCSQGCLLWFYAFLLTSRAGWPTRAPCASRRPCMRCDVPLSTAPGLSNPDVPGLGQGSLLQLGASNEIIPTPANQLRLNTGGFLPRTVGPQLHPQGWPLRAPWQGAWHEGDAARQRWIQGHGDNSSQSHRAAACSGPVARRPSVRSTTGHPRAS